MSEATKLSELWSDQAKELKNGGFADEAESAEFNLLSRDIVLIRRIEALEAQLAELTTAASVAVYSVPGETWPGEVVDPKPKAQVIPSVFRTTPVSGDSPDPKPKQYSSVIEVVRDLSDDPKFVREFERLEEKYKPKAAEWLLRRKDGPKCSCPYIFRLTKSGGVEAAVYPERPDSKWFTTTVTKQAFLACLFDLEELPPASPDSVPWRLKRWYQSMKPEITYRLTDPDGKNNLERCENGEWGKSNDNLDRWLSHHTINNIIETWPATFDEDGREATISPEEDAALDKYASDVAELMPPEAKTPGDEVAEVITARLFKSIRLDDFFIRPGLAASDKFIEILAPILAKAKEDRETVKRLEQKIESDEDMIEERNVNKALRGFLENEKQRAEKAEADCAELKSLLAALKWSATVTKDHWQYPACPVCKGTPINHGGHGHDNDCNLIKTLSQPNPGAYLLAQLKSLQQQHNGDRAEMQIKDQQLERWGKELVALRKAMDSFEKLRDKFLQQGYPCSAEQMTAILLGSKDALAAVEKARG